MKARSVLSTLAALTLGATTAHASVFLIDISPSGGALNLGSNTYTGDHAIGLAAPNAVGQPTSSATGNEIGGGITYDDVTNVLSYDLAYGSAFGFADLVGDFTVAHVHGPITVNFPAPNTGAGVVFGLAGHAPSGTHSGRFTGSSVLSAAQEADLFDNEFYINIHSSFAGGGEIRGQLIPVIPEPATQLLLLAGAALALRRRRSTR